MITFLKNQNRHEEYNSLWAEMKTCKVFVFVSFLGPSLFLPVFNTYVRMKVSNILNLNINFIPHPAYLGRYILGCCFFLFGICLLEFLLLLMSILYYLELQPLYVLAHVRMLILTTQSISTVLSVCLWLLNDIKYADIRMQKTFKYFLDQIIPISHM